MPTIPTVPELLQFVANTGTILAIIAVAFYEFRRRRTAAGAEEDRVVNERTCNAIHAAESAKLADLSQRVDSLAGTVEKLAAIVERLNATVGDLNTALAVLADRDGARLEDLGPKPRTRKR